MENIKIKNIIILLIVVLLTALYLTHWLGCHLDSRFFFSSLDLKLRIIFDVRDDQNVPFFVARLLHNKITQGGIDIFNNYVYFWNIRFLMLLLSPLTLFGILSWIFFVAKGKIKLKFSEKIIVFTSLFLPFLILSGIIKNEKLSLIIFSLPLIFISFRGFFLGIKIKHYWIMFFIIFILSIWYLGIISNEILNFCHL